jgi:hypothetical protein
MQVRAVSREPHPPAVYARDLQVGDWFRFASPGRNQTPQQVIRLDHTKTGTPIPVVVGPAGGENQISSLAHVVIVTGE